MYCTNCGKQVPDKQPICPHCGQPLGAVNNIQYTITPPAKSSKKGFGCAMIILGMIVLGIIGSALDKSEKAGQQNNNSTVATPAAEFSGDCGIEASAYMDSDQFINHPRLTINIRNTSKKDIAAIKFLAVPYDVYGEEIESFATQERLNTDDLIKQGKQTQLCYGPFLLTNIKFVKLYVYSVYYTDGSSWGNRNATRSEILSQAKVIHSTFKQ